MKKKKILITMASMFLGGAERSLIGLLNAFDYSKYDVDLFLYRHEGELLEFIPKEVNLLKYNKKYDTLDRPIKNLLLSKQFFFGIKRIVAKIQSKVYCKKNNVQSPVWVSMQYINKNLLSLLPNISGEYDLAIGFNGIHNILADKITANIKLGWIHTDYNILEPNRSLDVQVFKKLDYIVNVSEECTNIFINHYPEFKSKAITIENSLSASFVKQQAALIDFPLEIDSSGIYKTICSVGRFSYAKNFDNVPCICKFLLGMGLNVKWYIIGYGGDEQLIKEKISEYNMENHVFLLGKKTNPYPYIKSCDIYAQPSRYEGKSVTVREAQMLCKPVVITNFATAISQVKDGIDGIIVPMDNESCAKEIYKLLTNQKLLKDLSNSCAAEDYSNSQEVEKICKLMEN